LPPDDVEDLLAEMHAMTDLEDARAEQREAEWAASRAALNAKARDLIEAVERVYEQTVEIRQTLERMADRAEAPLRR